MSQRTGVSVESLSQLSYVAEQNSTSLEALQSSLVKMAAFMEAARHGSSEAITTLKELGLTYEDLKNMPADEQLKKFAEALSHTTSKSTQSVMAMKVFGKGAVDLLPMLNMGSAGITAMMAEADRLGITMSGKSAAAAAEFGDSLDRLKASFNAVIVQIGSQFTPYLTELADGFANLVATNGDSIRMAVTMVVAFGTVVAACKVMTLATQAYATATAFATALAGGPMGWAKVAAGMLLAGGVAYELNNTFDEMNQRTESLMAANSETAAGIDNLTNSSRMASSAIRDTSDAVSRFQMPSIDTAELDSYADAARDAATELDAVRAKRAELSEAFRAQGGMGGQISVADIEEISAREAAAAKKARAANELYANKSYAANAANRQQLPDFAPAYMKAQKNPDLPPAKFDSDSLNQYRRDAEKAVEQLDAVRAKRKELTDAFRAQGGMGGQISVDMLEGIAAHEAAAFRAAQSASNFAATKIAESTAEALAVQTKAAAKFADSFDSLKNSLLSSSEAAAADFREIYQAWSTAGSQSAVRFEEMLALQDQFAEKKSGFTDQFRTVTDELRVLRGEITETDLALERMGQFGVDDKQLAKLKELRKERDELEKGKADTADKKSQADDKLKSLTATRDNVLQSLMTPVEKALAEFRTKADEVNASVAAGLLDPAKAAKYLADEQKRLSEGLLTEKFKQASNSGIDAKSRQANTMLVDLVNRRGTPTSNKDQSIEFQRAIAKETTRSANEIAGMRLDAMRRETIQTKPFNQRT